MASSRIESILQVAVKAVTNCYVFCILSQARLMGLNKMNEDVGRNDKSIQVDSDRWNVLKCDDL